MAICAIACLAHFRGVLVWSVRNEYKIFNSLESQSKRRSNIRLI
ncbi:MAG: hypothetical protein ACKESC_01510 [Candidatus Hodgkinia cicadicola]